MYNLIQYNSTNLKTSGILRQYYKDEPALNNNGTIIDTLAADNNSCSFKLKGKTAEKIGNNGTENVKLIRIVPLGYLSNFWGTLETLLINCERNYILNWPANCFIIAGAIDNQVPAFAITDTKLYILVVTLLTQDNSKLLQQLKFDLQEQLTITNINQKQWYRHGKNI